MSDREPRLFRDPTFEAQTADVADEWFYESNRARNGPVSGHVIRQMVREGRLSTWTLVWRKGMHEWVPVGRAGLRQLDGEPPPLPTKAVGNGYAWFLASLPLIYAVVVGALGRSLSSVWDLLAYALSSTTVVGLDWYRIKRAGRRTPPSTMFVVFCTPLYLFFRARRLHQRQTYTIAWILLAAVGAFIRPDMLEGLSLAPSNCNDPRVAKMAQQAVSDDYTRMGPAMGPASSRLLDGYAKLRLLTDNRARIVAEQISQQTGLSSDSIKVCVGGNIGGDSLIVMIIADDFNPFEWGVLVPMVGFPGRSAFKNLEWLEQ